MNGVAKRRGWVKMKTAVKNVCGYEAMWGYSLFL